jgi:antitoxin HigA-1
MAPRHLPPASLRYFARAQTVSPAVAVRLGKLIGDGAGVWVRMQAAYHTWNAERKEDVSKIPTLPKAA